MTRSIHRGYPWPPMSANGATRTYTKADLQYLVKSMPNLVNAITQVIEARKGLVSTLGGTARDALTHTWPSRDNVV